MNRRLTRLFISNVNPKGSLNELEKLFGDYGRVTNFDVKDTNGYIEFENQKDANEAIKNLDGYKFSGKKLEVEYAVKSTNNFVKNKRDQFQNEKDSGRCFNCKEKGHIAKRCPKSRKDESSSRSRSRSKNIKKENDKKNNKKESNRRRSNRSKSKKSSSNSK